MRMQVGRGATDKYLAIGLHRETFALPILKVREIIRLLRITPLPQTAAHVRGIVNLRGRVIPVLDLRTRLGLPPVADNRRTCVVVVQVGPAGATRAAGLLVDQVDEVLNLPADAITPVPVLGDGRRELRGIARLADRVVPVVDVDALVGDDADQPHC